MEGVVPIRVVQLIPSLGVGGAERVVVSLCAALDALSAETHLIVADASGPFRQLVTNETVVHDLSTPSIHRAAPALVRRIASIRPDLVISHLTHLNVLATLFVPIVSPKSRLLVVEHSVFDVRRSRLKRDRVYRAMARGTYPRATTVVAVSRAVKDSLVRSSIRSNIVVIPNALPLDEIRRQAREPIEPVLSRYVVAVGRLVPQKDFGLLLQAFALAKDDDVKLVILGEGPERNALERLAGELGISRRVMMPGVVKNPYPWIEGAAALVMSSSYEGLGMVLVEAMALRTPIVAVESPAVKEVLEGGRQGRLVPSGSPRSLARAIEDALDGRVEPASEGFNPLFDPLTMATRYLEAAGLAPNGAAS